MSRNLEVLEQLQQDRELFRVPPVASGRSRPDGKAFAVSSAFPDGDSLGHEELIGLAQRLFLAGDADGHSRRRQVVFCGVDEIDGTGALCAQLGRTLASQVPSQVCVVDANVRTPMLHHLLKVEPPNGQLSSAAPAQSQLLQRIASNLWLISGHPAAENGGVTSSLDQVRSQIKELPPKFAYVVVSAPPIGVYRDAVLLGQKADGVVLVLEANSTRRVAARKAKQVLETANVAVLGMVLNNRSFPIPEKIYRLL